MSRKDYEAIAKVFELSTPALNSHGRPTAAEVLRRRMAVDMALYFGSQNPKFDFHKFCTAANVDMGYRGGVT